jgi:hypothetical protein
MSISDKSKFEFIPDIKNPKKDSWYDKRPIINKDENYRKLLEKDKKEEQE